MRLLLAAVVALALAACRGTAPPATTAAAVREQPAAKPSPKLVVLIVIDQLPAWSFDAIEPHLSGGLARLLREGTRLGGRYPYAGSLTAPGHATLGTGVAPRESGVFVNERYDRALHRVMSSVDDADVETFVLVDEPPSRRGGGSSSWQLQVEGTADALRQATAGRGKSVAISVKDRAAILPLGRRPDLALWYDPKQPAMTTSTAYASEPPPWLVALARQTTIPDALDGVWTPEDPVLLERAAMGPDDAPGELGYLGLGATFPHALTSSTDPAVAFTFTPASDAMLIDTAMAAIVGEGLGEDDVPDVLSISFSAHDKAGHIWGQESWERTEVLLRLDAALGGFFAALDERVGPQEWSVVLTSDHGATPRVETAGKPGAIRIATADIERAANEAAAEVLGDGEWVALTGSRMLWMSDAVVAKPEDVRRAAVEAVATAVESVPGIAHAWVSASLMGDCEARPALEQAVCLSLPEGRAGEVYFVPAEYSVIGSSGGTTHGSPYDYDRQVPILIRAPWAEVVETDEAWVDMRRVEPTVARLLGIDPPPTAQQAPLVRTP